MIEGLAMKKHILAAVLSATVLISGCTDLREIEPAHVQIGESAQTTSAAASASTATTASSADEPVMLPETQESAVPTADKPEVTTASQTTTAATTTAQATTTATLSTISSAPPVETEEPSSIQCGCSIPFGVHYLDEAEKEFLNDAIFVGDSICLGFGSYKVVPSERVVAKGSLGAWSFFDYKFTYNNKEHSYEYMLGKLKPKYVFLSMGMNDVNITGAQGYCENYSKIIDLTLEKTVAEVYICAITPVDSNFTSNERIQSFNEAMRGFVSENYPSRVHCIDYGKLFLCEDGESLCDILSGGDGIHLAPYAYHMALWEINNVLKANAQTAE